MGNSSYDKGTIIAAQSGGVLKNLGPERIYLYGNIHGGCKRGWALILILCIEKCMCISNIRRAEDSIKSSNFYMALQEVSFQCESGWGLKTPLR